MIDPRDAQGVPSTNEIIKTCHKILSGGSVDDVFEYLHIVASNTIKCPDRCDAWALEFFEENEDEITEKFYEVKLG